MSDCGERQHMVICYAWGTCLDEASIECVYDFDSFWICHRDSLWTQSDNRSILLMQLDMLELRTTPPYYDQPPEIRQCCKGRTNYMVDVMAIFVMQKICHKGDE